MAEVGSTKISTRSKAVSTKTSSSALTAHKTPNPQGTKNITAGGRTASKPAPEQSKGYKMAKRA